MLFSATQSEATNGTAVGMDASESYDSAYQKYENAKGLVHQITDTINTGFKNVQNIMTKYQSSVPRELITELSTEVNNTKTILKDLFSQDPGLFEPTQLEQQLDAYESEKQKGYQLVKNLQSQIESLQTEKQNWQLREQKGIKTMEEYKRQLAQYKNGTYPQQQTDSNKKPLNGVIDDDETNGDINEGNQIQELEKELELAQTSFGDMRKMVDSLSSENKSLSAQVLTLREQVGQLTRRQLQAQAQIAQQTAQQIQHKHKNGYNTSSSQHEDLSNEKNRATTLAARYKSILNEHGIKSSNLVRTNTENPMGDKDQQALKDELAGALQAMVKEQLNERTMQMMNFADGTQQQQNNDNNIVSMGAIDENEEDDDDRQQMRKLKEEMEAKQGLTAQELKEKEEKEALKRKQDKLMGSVFSGPSYNIGNNINDDRDAMKKMKKELEEELGTDAQGARKDGLMKMISKQDFIADSEQEATLRSALSNNKPLQDIQQNPSGMVDLDARQEVEKKLQQEMNEEQETMEQMQQAIAKQKRDHMFALTERSMRNDNVDPDEELKKIRMEKAAALYADPDENEAIRQAYKARLTETLDHNTNPNNNITTTTITNDHQIIFEQLMQSIGIVNDTKKVQIWKQIEDIVHEDKDVDINLPRGHSVTRSMMEMDREEIMDVFKQELEEQAAQHYVQNIEELKQENENNLNRLQLITNERDSLQNQIDSYHDSLTKQTNQLNQKEMKINELTQQLQEMQDMAVTTTTPQGPPVTYLPDENDDDNNTPIQSNIQYVTPIGPDPNKVELVGVDKPIEDQPAFIQLQNQIETLKQEKINLKSHYDDQLDKVRNEIKDNQQEIRLLNDEIVRISKAKCQLVVNTAQTIDSLRQLLRQYNDAIPTNI